MSDNTQHIKQYSAADIRRYLQGQMTADEMHALEKAALDDPFLADAIEGMEQTLQQHDSSVITTNLQELNQRLQQRIAPSQAEEKAAPVISMRWWQAAAAAVVLIVGSIFVYNSVTNDDNPNKTLAVTETQTTTPKETKDSVPFTAPATVDAATQQGESFTTSPGIDKQDLATAKERKPADVLSRRAKQTPPPAAANAVPENLTITPDTTQVFAFHDNKSEKNNAADSDKNKAAIASVTSKDVPQNNAARKQSDEMVTEVVKVGEPNVKKGLVNQTTVPDKELSNVIRGKVTDPFNNPLANAQLSTRHDSNVSNYLTDRNGDFRIPTADSTLNVAISAKGFEPRNMRLQQNMAANQVQLQPATTNSQEGAVNNYRNQARTAQTISQNKVPTILGQDAQPVYGWVAYEQYLEKNKRVPETAVNTRGEVVVSFTVSRKGNLSDFKIEQSVSKELDEEAVRLIKVGPSWNVLKGRKARAMVIVKF